MVQPQLIEFLMLVSIGLFQELNIHLLQKEVTCLLRQAKKFLHTKPLEASEIVGIQAVQMWNFFVPPINDDTPSSVDYIPNGSRNWSSNSIIIAVLLLL